MTFIPLALLPIEREALRLAIATVRQPARRAALEHQLTALRVREREFTGAGFYTCFDCPAELRSPDLPDETNHTPPGFGLLYPNGKGALEFLLYVKDGAIDFLEAASSRMWPEDRAANSQWPEDEGPITFDPALIRE